MNATLFDLTAEQLELTALVERGELTAEDVADNLESNQGMIQDKILDYCRVESRMASEQTAIENEIERLKGLLESKKSKRSGLVQNLQHAMEALGMEEFDVGIYKGRINKGRESVVIDNPDALPVEMVTTKVTYAPNKTAIKAAIDTGTLVAGARIDRAAGKLVIK